VAHTESGTKDLPKVISVDDHAIEPAHLFETWLPARYRDRGPKPLTAGIGELATDYPHVDSTWPETRRVAEEHVGGLSDEVAYKLLRGNAFRMLDLPFDRGDRALSEAP